MPSCCDGGSILLGDRLSASAAKRQKMVLPSRRGRRSGLYSVPAVSGPLEDSMQVPLTTLITNATLINGNSVEN